MNKLSLDMSSSCTGYGIRINEKLIKFGDIKYKHKDFKVRVVEIVKAIKNICKENEINFVTFEDIQDKKFAHAGKVLAFMQGALVYMLEEEKVSYCPITIHDWRKNVGIKSRIREEQKEEAIKLVQTKYNIVVGEDCAEAILIGEFDNFEFGDDNNG